MKIFSAAAINLARVASRLSRRVNLRGFFIYMIVSRYMIECKLNADGRRSPRDALPAAFRRLRYDMILS
jgi:hypothetical protein